MAKLSQLRGAFKNVEDGKTRGVVRRFVSPFQGLEGFLGNLTQGDARGLALPWAIFFWAFSPEWVHADYQSARQPVGNRRYVGIPEFLPDLTSQRKLSHECGTA